MSRKRKRRTHSSIHCCITRTRAARYTAPVVWRGARLPLLVNWRFAQCNHRHHAAGDCSAPTAGSEGRGPSGGAAERVRLPPEGRVEQRLEAGARGADVCGQRPGADGPEVPHREQHKLTTAVVVQERVAHQEPARHDEQDERRRPLHSTAPQAASACIRWRR